MITDPEAIRFANEIARPLAEKARAFRAEVEGASTQWFAGIDDKFPNDSTPVDDGREAEGVSRLTGADITNLISILVAMNGAGNTQVISKPCVRSLTVS